MKKNEHETMVQNVQGIENNEVGVDTQSQGVSNLGFISVVDSMDDTLKNTDLLAKIKDAHAKIIEVGPISSDIKKNFSSVALLIDNLIKQINQKRDGVISQISEIKKRVSGLMASGLVQIDENEYKKSEESVKQYTALLDGICQELAQEKLLLEKFIGDKHPEGVIVGEDTTESFADAAAAKIKAVKHHLKTIDRDLGVSYSRYHFGFESQLRRIIYVENALKRQVQK
ncbi:MAG: hypothetical protein US69_C0010G0041 [candidate division TM6 bacterium GW2011_GWF2_38_10]|nr:MAG: hypothetical protein US69_C0010G0041 [candidate division TM6 bacterium GW2011_GWF2_38_10]